MISEARYKANKKYNAKAYDNIAFTVPKGERDFIKSAAEAAGESLAEYIRNAIKVRMKAEGMLTESAAEQVPDPEMETVTGGVKSYEIPGSHDMTKE